MRQPNRFFYASNGAFEQSLDVYLPGSSTHSAPLVILVVGSAWLGHLPIIYKPTSWFNAQAPRAIARSGAICLCVRHRGAFPKSPPPTYTPTVFFSFFAAAILRCSFLAAMSVAVVSVILLRAWANVASSSATHAQMVDDVATALVWIKKNSVQINPKTIRVTCTWFAGYSSGSHVASSLLAKSDSFFIERGLPTPSKGGLCDAVLHLSGVFGSLENGNAAYQLLSSAIFGSECIPPAPVSEASLIPSKIPHVFVRCSHEVFGVPWVENWMHSILGGAEYPAALKSRGLSVREFELQSNHWTMLWDPDLIRILATELKYERPLFVG